MPESSVQTRLSRTWAMLRNNGRIWLLGLRLRWQPAANSGQKPVIFFNASTRLSGVSQNAAYAFLTSSSLKLAGAPVMHFACQAGMSRCQLGTNPDKPDQPPPCSRCIFQSRILTSNAPVRWFQFQPDPAVAAVIKDLQVPELLDFEHDGVPLGALTRPSLRWTLRRYHLEDDEPTRSLFREFILSAWNVYQSFSQFLNDVDPAAVVVFNGIAFPEGTARWVAQQRGIRVISHEVAHQPLTAFFSEGHVTAYPVQIPDNFVLSPAQNKLLDNYLEQRFQGNFTMAGVRFWPEIQNLSVELVQKISQYKQLIPIFTNVIFDTSQEHANVVFEHMFAWLDQVYQLIQNHPETLFIIRAHPDEMRPGKSSRESVNSWVLNTNLLSLSNVVYIGSSEYISSYALIQRSKFVMAYNSTIGLEAALMGKPVLNGGKARYTSAGCVFFPDTLAGHQQLAEKFLSAETLSLPENFLENARRFQYYQLFRTPLPFHEFLRTHPSTRGYVQIKSFPLAHLHPDHSPTMDVIYRGILEKHDFLMSDPVS